MGFLQHGEFRDAAVQGSASELAADERRAWRNCGDSLSGVRASRLQGGGRRRATPLRGITGLA